MLFEATKEEFESKWVADDDSMNIVDCEEDVINEMQKQTEE